jgi:hypothetical protein
MDERYRTTLSGLSSGIGHMGWQDERGHHAVAQARYHPPRDPHRHRDGNRDPAVTVDLTVLG